MSGAICAIFIMTLSLLPNANSCLRWDWLREGVKADHIATSLREAVSLYMEATGAEDQRRATSKMENPTTEAA